MGTVTAEQVREELGRPLKDSTIRTVLRRLEEKGYLAHAVENRTFLYRPAEIRQRVAGRAVKRIVDWFCEGSVEALLVGMVDSKVLGRAELQRLAERIAAAQQSRAGRTKGGKMMIPAVICRSARSRLARAAGRRASLGAVVRLLRVRNVLAQKTAWRLVLAAALTMPSADALGCASDGCWRCRRAPA